MTEHVNDIEQELRKYEAELYAASIEYKDYCKQEALADAEALEAEARATLEVMNETEDVKKILAAEKEAMVAVKIADQALDARLKKGLAKGSRAHLDTLQSLLSSVQSRASLFKTEMSLVGRQI